MDGTDSGAPRRWTGERGWLRAAGLFLVVSSAATAVAHPSVLIAVPYGLMAVVLPARRWPAYAVGALMLATALTAERDGLWWTEFGWAVLVAGWFVALTLRWPASRFLPRGLGAVAGAVLVLAAMVGDRVGGWELLDWQVTERVRAWWAWLLGAAQAAPDSESLTPAVVNTLYGLGELQAEFFPALATLGSLAGLGVAWWVYVRIGHDNDSGLRPLREFRFNDHLVWLFIAGLSLTLFDVGDGARRAGANAAAFMGALYALRGAAVVKFFGGVRSPFTLVLLVLALLLAAPVVLVGALVIGLGDTWLDLRGRARASTA